MLKAIVEFSIRRRGIVIAIAATITAYGIWVAAHAKLDVFPEFAPPQVVIQTEAPGLSAEEVELLVTRAVENAVNGVGNLEAIRSQSILGLSVVTAVFKEGTGIHEARQQVAERIAQIASELPKGVHAPKMMPLTSSTSLVLGVGLTSQTRRPMDLRTLADWTIRPRLLGVPGVANVVIFGGEVRQIQIQVLPEKLLAYDLSIEEVLEAARNSTGVLGAGFVETEAQRITVQTEGQSLTAEALGGVIVAHREGASVRLCDVARVRDGPEPKMGDGAVDGTPGVILQIWAQFGANTLEVTRAVERALEEMRPAIEAQEIRLHPRLFRPASFVEQSVHNVNVSLLMGGVLVAAVLALFLFNARTVFISLTAIPLSLLVAVIVLDRFGATLNTLTLGGLAIAIGMVVDDAIVAVENIHRRLRTSPARHPAGVVLDAALEVRPSVVHATFIVALVFVPVLTMSGVQGKLFAPLGIAYLLATLASLVVALTLTPALSMALLAGSAGHGEETRFVRGITWVHRRLLEPLIERPWLLMGGAILLLVGAALAVPFLGGEFLPEFREGHFIIQQSAVPGTSLPESMRIGGKVAEELKRHPKVRSVSFQAGRAELGEDTTGPDFGEYQVALEEMHGEEAEETQAGIRKTLAQYPGLYFGVKTFLTERMEETIGGVKGEFAVKIYGDDLDVLDRKAQEVFQTLSSIQGAADVKMEAPPGEPQIIVRLRPDRLRRFGLQPIEVLTAVQVAYQGVDVAQTFPGNRVFDVALVLPPEARRDPERIGLLQIRTREGLRVPLAEVAELFQTQGRHAVLHDGTRRYQAVVCNIRGRDDASFVEEAERLILERVKFPAGTYAVFAGAAESQAAAKREIVLHSVLAGAGILLLLAIVFRRARNLLLVIANLPFAFVGGVFAAFLSGGTLSIGSLVGFVALFGITMRNSIMMVSHWEHLVTDEGVEWGREAALRGASERLVPILMTALVTALGLVPMALGSGEPGREIEGPMSIVILGGLATSTVLNLLVLPTLALRFGRFERDAEIDRVTGYRPPP